VQLGQEDSGLSRIGANRRLRLCTPGKCEKADGYDEEHQRQETMPHERQFKLTFYPSQKQFYLRRLLKQIRLFAGDTREQRLKLKPSREMASDLFPGREGSGMIDLHRLARALGE
jgi:hypothetical protein